MNSGVELYKQLDFNVGGGIEVRMSSNLPQGMSVPCSSESKGSGLGTSSILAGALLAVWILILRTKIVGYLQCCGL